MAGRIYSNEFKIQAVKRVVEDGVSSAQVARELGININTLREWVKRYKENQNEPFVGSDNLRTEAQNIRELEKRIRDLEMDSTMTKQLTIEALKDAVNHSGDVKGCILHSDRGSQYCSIDYQNFVHANGFIISMSRKGNCWDNAPMECFWGKMKQEWLNDQHFKTREEAKKAVFEYICIFYNRIRIHASNDYMMPEEYYSISAQKVVIKIQI